MFRIITILLCFACNSLCMAACDFYQYDTTRRVYDGYIDLGNKRIPIGMYLIFDNDPVIGLYSYTDSTSDIKLQGRKFDNDTAIELHEITENGTSGEKFTGTCSEDNDNTRTRTDCNVIVGKWYDPKKDRSYPFYLNLTQTGGGSIEHFYGYEEVQDDEVINKAVSRFKNAVRENNKKLVASMIEKYPIYVSINRKIVEINSRSHLIKLYDKIFTAEYKEKILKARGRYLPLDPDSGIPLHHGFVLVWFYFNGNVITFK